MSMVKCLLLGFAQNLPLTDDVPFPSKGTYFLQQRVGHILKNGFELAGRDFEFLAYSTSALREHAVWFVHPFHLPSSHPSHSGTYVNGHYIRQSLGDFSNVIRQPSKYAARIAQAFTATDPSVKVTRDQWEEMEDIGEDDRYLHTDGVGTISLELAGMIWAELCVNKWDYGGNTVRPFAVGHFVYDKLVSL